MPRRLTPHRRKAVLFAAMPSILAAAFGPIHETYAHNVHEHAIFATYLALMCVPITLSIRELVKSKREGACSRS